MFLGFIIFLLGLILISLVNSENGDDGYAFTFFISFVLLVLSGALTIGSYFGQVHDVGTAIGQHHVIKVQEQRISSLQERLTSLSDPMGNKEFLLNADSPFTSLITELAKAESDLATSRTTKAIALRDIEKRKIGPFWFVTKLVKVEE